MTFSMPWIGGRRSSTDNGKAVLADLSQKVSRAADQTVELASRQTDTLGKQAGMIGKQAGKVGEQAARLGQEAGRLGQQYGRQASSEAARLSRELAATGGAAAAGGATNLRALGDDLRSLRVVRRSAARESIPGIALISGLAGGLAAMFFLDPEQGRRRRTMARDKLGKWLRLALRGASGRTVDLRNRAIGVAHEARSAVSGATESLAGDEVGFGGPLSEETPDISTQLEQTEEVARSGAGL
jgi:hypothetical protein